MNIFLFLLIISLINLLIVAFMKEHRTLILDHYENQINQNLDDFNEEKSVSISIYYGLFFRNFGLKPIMTVLSLIMGFHLSSSIGIGFLIGLNFLIQVLLMLLIGHIIKEKNDKLILILGYFFSSIAILGYIFATDFFGFLIAQVFVAFSYSMFWSASVIHIAQNTTPLNKGSLPNSFKGCLSRLSLAFIIRLLNLFFSILMNLISSVTLSLHIGQPIITLGLVVPVPASNIIM